MASGSKGPGLYEFLIEAELQQYYSAFKTQLKVGNVSQLKYVTEEDLSGLGLTKPEIRRLKKFFHKYFPQTYLSKFKKKLLSKKEDGGIAVGIVHPSRQERPPVKVPSKHIIPAEAIVINKELGTGEFGVVQQGIWTNEEGDRIQVAIKCLSKDRMQANPLDFLKEAAIMHGIDHEHIVRLYGVVLDTDALMLVTELAPLRSLLECLKEPALRPTFTVFTLCDFAVQICDGMSYLESKRLIHRDLAARNILVFTKHKVKISDFGLSRALGVGKDYYQTNFNVNLKLPIAWCAPECINYLRFTSASDVWAYGVTLWEMFSYGFQPWAALTGQQILEAIDEPHFHRLEQPEHCPREYYSIMLRCWQHDPAKRPHFSELLTLLPDCKPEQVQAIAEYEGPASREQLMFRAEDIITVLDKKPIPESSSTNPIWKGVLPNGKTGLFLATKTVAYLGTKIPCSKHSFNRGDGKNVYSSKRRLTREMISCPQADFRHTGHVGIDGAFFGDVPKQVVSPFNPQQDEENPPLTPMTPGPSLTRAPSDLSDRAPLLTPKTPTDKTKNGPASLDTLWVHQSTQRNQRGHATPEPGEKPAVGVVGPLTAPGPHEYHEISSDEEELNGNISPGFDAGFGLNTGSLVDEIFSVLTSTASHVSPPVAESPNEAHNARNEIREIEASAAAAAAKTGPKKKQATVKPMSATDQRILEAAITKARELASQSVTDLGVSSPEGDEDSSVPLTPVSPNKRKFTFKLPLRSSPKGERKPFSSQASSIPDIQSTLTEEAKEAYNALVEKPASAAIVQSSSEDLESPIEDNPLRRLRSVGAPLFVPPGRAVKKPPVLPPVLPKPRPAPLHIPNSNFDVQPENGSKNPLPLPPRDRSKPSFQADEPRRHQRIHPLVIPDGLSVNHATVNGAAGISAIKRNDPGESRPIGKQPTAKVHPQPIVKPDQHHVTRSSATALDDSFETQIAAELDSLEKVGPLYTSGDHVSCEDLLEFALDRPNAQRTRGRAHGIASDEVRIMIKVLSGKVQGEECQEFLNATDWNIHEAVKLARLHVLLKEASVEVGSGPSARQALQACEWDVQRAFGYLVATCGPEADVANV